MHIQTHKKYTPVDVQCTFTQTQDTHAYSNTHIHTPTQKHTWPKASTFTQTQGLLQQLTSTHKVIDRSAWKW